jgi:hypothetical protein
MGQNATNIFKHGNVDYSTFESATLQLVSEFYNANLFDPTALDNFVNNYAEYLPEIKRLTKAADIGPRIEGQQTSGVTNAAEAVQVLNDNKIPRYMNAGRKIGLVTGINPQQFAGNRASGLSISDQIVRAALANLFNESTQPGFEMNTGLKDSDLPGTVNYEQFAEGAAYGVGGATGMQPLPVGLWHPAVLEYLRRRYIRDVLQTSVDLTSPVLINAVKELYEVHASLDPEDLINGLRPPSFSQPSIGRARYEAGLKLINDTIADPTNPDLLNTSLATTFAAHGLGRESQFANRFISVENFFLDPSYDVNVQVLELFEILRPEIDATMAPRYAGDDLKRKNRELNYIYQFFNASEAAGAIDSPLDQAAASDITDKDVNKGIPTPVPNLKPYDFQCFLFENISKLVDKRKSDPLHIAQYKNLIRLNSNGDPGTVLNRIESGGAGTKEFLDICPDIYGLLTPYIKISRLEYDQDGKIAIDPNTKKPVVRDLKIPNFLTQDQLQDILSPTGGRIPGAGIKSFSWSLDGVQPAEVDNNITANLIMYFQSVNDFFNGARQAGEAEPNFLDLIINSPSLRKQNKKADSTSDASPSDKTCSDDIKKELLHRDYDGKDFRVQVTAGWSTPPLAALEDLMNDSGKAKALHQAIRASKTTLYLQMTQHQINFNQNGSLELSISYRASLAGLLSGKTSNILDESGKTLAKDIEDVENKIKKLKDELPGSATIGRKSAHKERVAELQQEIKELRAIDRNVKYKKLLRKLFFDNSASTALAESGTKIHSLSVNPFELSQANYADLSPEARAARVKRKLGTNLEIDTVASVSTAVLDAINKNKAGTGKDVAEAAGQAEFLRFQDLAKANRVSIPYFYLGDLFDAVLEQIKDNYPEELGKDGLNFKFFMSDVEMIDPLQAFKIENLEGLLDCGYSLRDISKVEIFATENPESFSQLNGIFRTMNIGDIPISLDTFQVWFKNNVIKNERSNYYLLYFIKDVCKDLITNALSSKCFGDGFKFEQRFDARPLTVNTNQSGRSRYSPGKIYTVGQLRAGVRGLYEAANPSFIELGLILYSTDSKPHGLSGKDPDSDRKKGIYHHYLGSACGLVKTINFQREDQPYLRESRIQKQGALGPEQLRELYSTNIDLVGNNLYKNGMYIYVNPSLLNADQTYLDYLGLHGYYLVTKVQSTITPTSFDVSIRALHEGVNFKQQDLQPSDITINEPDNPEDPPPEYDQEDSESPLERESRLAAALPPGSESKRRREAIKEVLFNTPVQIISTGIDRFLSGGED